MKKNLFNNHGIVLITLLIWIIIIGSIVIFGPRIYNWYVEQEEIKIWIPLLLMVLVREVNLSI